MSLELISQKLKDFVASYDTQWFMGSLTGLMNHIPGSRANDQLGKLSSPLRQLYFLGGLLVSSDPGEENKISYSKSEWNTIVKLLNEIELEYDKLFFPNSPDEVDEQWKLVRNVAMPAFLSYFNQGPLNYEEQTINLTTDLFSQLDSIIELETGLKTQDFIQFYENLDRLHQRNFQSIRSPFAPLRSDWKKYTKLEFINNAPPELGFTIDEKHLAQYHFMADNGIIDRFYPEELISEEINIDKVKYLLKMLTTTRVQTDYLYYTAKKPGNPLYEKPIVDIGDNLFQIFEVKQVLHAIENILEQICNSSIEKTTKYVEKKGKLLEERIVNLFSDFLVDDFKKYQGYYVDGCEQDVLILWKNIAFIIEAKGYSIREPLRDPNRAFVRIKDDFNASIGYGHIQTHRVEKKFIDQIPLRITDKMGHLIDEIDTSLFEYDFSVIVNIESFGQLQNDLSTLLKLETDDSVYPWVIKIDDLEVFLLTLQAQNSNPKRFVEFLLMRENLHGKLICSDELQVCGGFLLKKFNEMTLEKEDVITTTNDLTELFDIQYNKGMGFKNEKYLYEKKSGHYLFI